MYVFYILTNTFYIPTNMKIYKHTPKNLDNSNPKVLELLDSLSCCT